MVKHHEKATRTFLVIGLILFVIAATTSHSSFYIIGGISWVIALYFFWKYKKI